MNKFGKQSTFWQHKLTAVPLRLLDVFRLLPVRLRRLGRHFTVGLQESGPMGQIPNSNQIQRFAWWWLELLILLLELPGIGELYEIGSELCKPASRPLTARELELAKSVFGFSIQNYERIRIDEAAYLGPKQGHFCYVSFYLINSWGSMRDSTLIHELVHVWQYEQIGAIYMPRALRAQRTQEGYNYGGITFLRSAIEQGKTFYDFNLEQQGDIIADYFSLQQGIPVQWGKASKKDLPVYQHFVSQLQKGLAFI